MDKQVKVTREALNALKKELDELVTKKRPKLVERLERARNEGDLSENSDYTNAKDELEFLDGRIDELKHVVENAVIIHKRNKDGRIGVGTKVTIKVDRKQHIYEIVGDWEADPVNKKISHESPRGKQLVGCQVGDRVEVEAPAGKINYEIVAVD
jgi:transcription elongation factor GreA